MATNSPTAVEIKEITLITPSEPTPSHVLPLSTLDSQLFLRFTIEYLLLYRSRKHTTATTTAARLKDALARALVPYYPLAGRVRPRPDSPLLLEVLCRAQGAYFIEATSAATLADFDRPPRSPTQWRNLLSVQVPDVLSGLPPLILQLTWLSNGDAAIAIGFNHCIIDGIGSADFLNSFADLASGRQRLSDLNPKPVWDRHLPAINTTTCRRANAVMTSSHPEFARVQDLSGFVARFSQEPLVPTSVVFDGKAIAELKKRAAGSWSGGYTSFEVVAGWVWRSWAGALEMEGRQAVRMVFSVNVRGRVGVGVGPTISKGFYGNGFVLGCAAASGRELGAWGVGRAAEAVRRAKEAVGEEYVRTVVEAVGAGACPDTVGVLVVSQWARLGLERVEFGLGWPVQVSPLCTDRYCLILPVSGQRDALRVVLALPRSAAAKYEYMVRNPTS